MKHGSLTEAAENLGVTYTRLSGAVSGRENIIHVVSAIQSDLNLSNTQVLALWPLLKSWPKQNRMAG